MESKNALRLRVSELQQNLITEYVALMKEKCNGAYALDWKEFEMLHENCMEDVLLAFAEDQKTDVVATQILKQQLQLKYIELKRENNEKPTVPAVASGVVTGAASGIGIAAGGAVGTTAVVSTFALSATVATGGLVLVGVAAVGVGIGVGVGIKKLVQHIQEKQSAKAKESSKKR